MSIKRLGILILLFALALFALALSACSMQGGKTPSTVHTTMDGVASTLSFAQERSTEASDGFQKVFSMERQFATEFNVDYLANGSALISIRDERRYLLLAADSDEPETLPEDVTVIKRPLDDIYLAATSAMSLFDSLDALDKISLSGTKAEGWFIENAREKMAQGDMVYAGKYSAPDYEFLLNEGTDLAIQSTMIYHAPEVLEKLEDLGIPVLVERSSYEAHPLGRLEWIKLYGLLLDKSADAKQYFAKQVDLLPVEGHRKTGKSVAFFYISSAGNAVVRRSNDYVVKMIELAGGDYVFKDLDDGKLTGSVNLEMERFYEEAKNADIIIYNSSIDGEIDSLAQLIGKNALIADFKAVESGDVWCTNKNMFQESAAFGQLIADIHHILRDEHNATDSSDQLSYLYRLD